MPVKDPRSSSTAPSTLLADICSPHMASDKSSRDEELSRSAVEPGLLFSDRVIDAMPESVIITDTDYRIVRVNPAFETMTGYSQQEVLGRTSAFLQGPQTDARTVVAIRQALRERRRYVGEILNYTKSGNAFWAEMSISPVQDGAGQVTHYMGTSRDISKRKREAARLHESETRYRDAAEAAGGYICDLDSSFRYTYLSEAAERILGFPAHEMLGKTPAQFMPPGEIDRVNVIFDKHKRPDGSMYGLEYRVVTKSGEVRWMQTSRVPLRDRQGKVVAYRGTTFDITARKEAEVEREELEAQLRESQKMQAVGTLAGGIAHEFNNIIAAILGNVSLAQDDVGADSPALESLSEIRKSASRGRDLVKQILVFSRRQQAVYAETSLRSVVREAVAMLRASLPARVTVDAHCDCDAPSVLADASQVQQVLVNLATNAMQAMGGHPGHVHIGLDGVRPDEEQLSRHAALRDFMVKHEGPVARVTVEDNGPGMDEETKSRIFEPFFTTKMVGEGSGLGLAVVHGIVEGHKGVTVVDSEPGRGARFTMYLPGVAVSLPVLDSDVNAEEAADDLAVVDSHSMDCVNADLIGDVNDGDAGAGGPHILCIDDDEMLLFVVKRLLERRGYRVSVFSDQALALQELRSHPLAYDLLLTDYNMPGMSGLDVARDARELRADLPIAIASGFIDETLSSEAASAGANQVLFKADTVEEFCAAIAAMLPASR